MTGRGVTVLERPARREPGRLQGRTCAYWASIKELQTGLLLVTGLAGYVSARCPVTTWETITGLMASLFLAISGSTVLNMVYDRDIDAKMLRTADRPLPSGRVTVAETLMLGMVLTAAGVAWAFAMAPAYGWVVLAGVFLDVVVYTVLLKRRTPWSIIWGGVAGGMPVLAGRVLAVGEVDLVGVLLALAVLLWIPTHIVTFSLKYAGQYRQAQVPVFPNTHGERAAHRMIGASTVLATVVMLTAGWLLGLRWGFFGAAGLTGLALLAVAVHTTLHPSPRLNLRLFKLASAYMLASMGIIMVGV